MPYEYTVVPNRDLTSALDKSDERSDRFALYIEHVGTFRNRESAGKA